MSDELVPYEEPDPKKFAAFAAKVEQATVASILAGAQAVHTEWNRGELIVKYAESEEIRDLVERCNLARQKQKLGGRPLLPHCYVAALLAAKLDCEKAHFERCARVYIKDRETGFTVGKRMATLIARGEQLSLKDSQDLFANGERLLPESVESCNGNEKLTPTEFAAKLTRPMQRMLFDNAGKAMLRPRAEIRAVIERLEDIVEPFGYEILPKAKK